MSQGRIILPVKNKPPLDLWFGLPNGVPERYFYDQHPPEAEFPRYEWNVFNPEKRYLMAYRSMQRRAIRLEKLEVVPISGIASTLAYLGSVMDYQGRYMYGVPRAETKVLKFDTWTHNYTLIGSLAAGDLKYQGAVSICKKVIMVPRAATGWLIINEDDSMSSVGSCTGAVGGCIAYNKVFSVPISSGPIYVLDLDTMTESSFGSGLSSYVTGIFYKGFFWYSPLSSGNFLKVDPLNRTYKTIGSGLSYHSALQIGSDGYLYSIESGTDNIKKIDPISDKFETITFSGSGLSSYTWNNIITRNGYLTAINTTGERIFLFDPINCSLTVDLITTGSVISYSASLSLNNKIYTCPHSTAEVRVYGDDLQPKQNLNFILAHTNNKY